MSKKLYTLLIIIYMLTVAHHAKAQQFFNLTAQQVSIDSVIPRFVHAIPLPDNFADSVYTVSIVYPEYIPMSSRDVARYTEIAQRQMPGAPTVEQTIVMNRKKAYLQVEFEPFVEREKPEILVSFMLSVKAKAKKKAIRKQNAALAESVADRYAAHSVLATGKWAKIRVPSTGVYQLTADVVQKAGFTDLSQVAIYGYGGNLINETLVPEELIEQDDLKEIPTCNVNGKKLFYARGPVSWKSRNTTERTRNPYSDYGYYLITQKSTEVLSVDSAAFVGSFYPANDDYHVLYETDDFAWMQGGRNLFESKPINLGSSQTFSLNTNHTGNTGTVAVAVTAPQTSTVRVALNDEEIGSVSMIWTNSTYDQYDTAKENVLIKQVNNLRADNNITITTTSGGPVRLDYISLTYTEPIREPWLTHDNFPAAQYVHNITNQDHHADGAADMVIIVPTSGKLLQQAVRLANFHEQHDGLRVNIVPADELYNEFSSATPDASAYRRYLKMLYDRAQAASDMPRYLLLFGDCAWDNRMKTSDWKNASLDDYLLCFESENSFNKVYCYVDDGFFCYLDDDEGAARQNKDKLDVAVGRFPVTRVEDAKTMVDKAIAYVTDGEAGAWQNTLVFMGDDGNNNLHMRDENDVADRISTQYPDFLTRKIMWDAYNRQSTSTGFTYPDVTKLIKQYQTNGALIMDYAGHGAAHQISHESVLKLSDFAEFKNSHLPLWITASCDIMPFDGNIENIGETAVLNKNGGAIAFFGTTRTVYANYNKVINLAFLRNVLSIQDGKPVTLGEAQRLAKNSLVTTGEDPTENKFQYALLGDPALALNLPTLQMTLDEINGTPLENTDALPTIKAGEVVTVKGHIVGHSDFTGTMTATVRDTEETIVCKLNDSSDSSGASTPFSYKDRTKTLFSGSNNVKDGTFEFTFAVPKDINYSDEKGLINLYAVNSDHTLKAQGHTDNFLVGGSSLDNENQVGPSIYCYLNTPSFVNGGTVNSTPYFVATVADNDGINATGNGIGHDLELIIDGEVSRTYILNDNFNYDFGSYTSGSTHYSIPELDSGHHQLLFRAWDILNNSSSTTLDFNVVKGLTPTLNSIGVTNNPATTQTTFIVNHDRSGSLIDVEITVFDLSGRPLWRSAEQEVSTSGAYTVNWDLTSSNGDRLQTGIYVYRVTVVSDGSKKTSKAKKLIIQSTR